MNFDELKNKWENQPIRDLKVEKDLDSMKSAANLLNELMKQQNRGVIMRGFSIVYLFIAPYIFIDSISNTILFIYYFFWFYFALTTVITIVRHKYLLDITKEYEVLSSKSTLMKVYYELKYFNSTNKLITIIDTPSGIGLMFIVFSRENTQANFSHLLSVTQSTSMPVLSWFLFLFFVSLLFTLSIIYFFNNKKYGSKIGQIKSILDDLGD